MRRGQHGWVELVLHGLAGYLDQTQVVFAGVAAQQLERGPHRYAEPLRDHAFGPLDDHPAVQAVCSCSVTTSPRRIARSDKMPMVATSARA